MAKEEWGVKRLCPTTGKRFYDLNKDPIVSPYTGEVVNLDTGNKSRVMIADKEDKNSAEKVVADEEVVLDDDADVDLADDLLDDDDDDDDDGDVSLDEIVDVAANDDDN
ncbi:TIGR02300 family protein [Pseudohalocynthiibacter aestuariivivens]|jgi:uncharacterized protein (TIGR02300 family)|uniref:TIGR02300 family protein n=1 Tax=Pseudohalocynthiibacter aestuariivivens TaxID=1591409 RepID=A0ABV5JFF1_9RHOB|nr:MULTISPECIES: TIGR02300 family protein [Pseudohalocynthiibacter]MBS9717032.1 TIGR02300 family protein [Pseudohalocynthiibacter aestuariivivens]MCK0101869.1 TIGR02300 family protein [Pseudohalocynthiibacter sp. F2068]